MFNPQKAEQFVNWFLEGQTTYEIAARAHCSPQYVSKVIRSKGVDVATLGAAQRRSRMAAKVARRLLNEEKERLSRQAHRKARNRSEAEKKYQPMRELWDKNNTLAEIASHLGKPVGTVKAQVHYLRANYGWFPTRRKRNP